MNIEIINARVDAALSQNRRAEGIVIGMSLAMFALGLVVALIGYWRENPYLSTGAILVEGLLYWPIREILKLRRENLMLQTLPSIVSTFPRNRVADEIEKMLRFLRGEKL